MRILQIIQTKQLRGAEIFACQLSEELIKNGDVVDVVYLYESKNGHLNFNLNFFALHGNKRRRFWDISAFRRLAKIIETGNYDIVQANAADTLKYAVFSRTFFRWRSKIIFRNASIMSAFIKGKVQLAFNKWMLRQCDCFISVSEHSRRDLMKLYPHAALASVTIPIGTQNFDIVSAAKRLAPTKDPILIAIGSFVREKNHIFLLEIFNVYYRKYANGYLWLVGDGKLRPQLEKAIAHYNLAERVRIWGYTNDAIALLKSADVLVMPSVIEGLPGVILEAISCEIPVVASDVGGIPEIIIDDVTGICISGYSAMEYADRIRKLLTNMEYRNGLVHEAKKKLLESYTLEKIGAEFIAHYHQLLKGK